MDIETRTLELAQQGYCCSQIIVKIGLEFKNKENEDLVRAMKGLCRGLYKQGLCGALSAGACLLSMYSEAYAPVLIPELAEWFEKRFSCVNCAGLIGADRVDLQKCLRITGETCARCFEILEEKGLLAEEA